MRAVAGELDLLNVSVSKLKDEGKGTSLDLPENLAQDLGGIISQCEAIVVDIESQLKNTAGSILPSVKWVFISKKVVGRHRSTLHAYGRALTLTLQLFSISNRMDIQQDTQKILAKIRTITGMLSSKPSNNSVFDLHRYIENATTYAISNPVRPTRHAIEVREVDSLPDIPPPRTLTPEQPRQEVQSNISPGYAYSLSEATMDVKKLDDVGPPSPFGIVNRHHWRANISRTPVNIDLDTSSSHQVSTQRTTSNDIKIEGRRLNTIQKNTGDESKVVGAKPATDFDGSFPKVLAGIPKMGLEEAAEGVNSTSLNDMGGRMPEIVSGDVLKEEDNSDDDGEYWDDHGSGGDGLSDDKTKDLDYTACSLECGYCRHCDY
ncbi:hypothetical protein B0J14DRAFT_681050 [Halenospora varia]|nr:hypothetical protein B0J14DRAFT_681050 [Halenospora varia]